MHETFFKYDYELYEAFTFLIDTHTYNYTEIFLIKFFHNYIIFNVTLCIKKI